MDTLAGTSIGGYTLIKLLGVGGMGSVYLANDPAVDQQVAVKVIRTDLDDYTDTTSAQAALERFRQEARAVAKLDHLHILPLYRYGEEQTPQGPRAYMIMQYRPEGSLWDWLRRRADFSTGQLQPTQAELASGLSTNWPLSLGEAADYLQQAASALQYAHDHGIVHRDIKPANFLLRVDPHEKHAHLLLSDFGLAKVFTASSATNTILGTPTYMAPEQFEGVARPETDQYALAVMIYYLLAGRPPFEGDPMQLMRQHLASPVPSVTSINPDVPPLINGVLVRALAKQPEQRFPSIATFAETFARVAKQPQPDYSRGAMQSSPSSYLPPMMRNDPSAIGGGAVPGNSQVGQASPGRLVLPGPAGSLPGRYNTPSPAPSAYPQQSPFPPMASNAYGAQTAFAQSRTPDVYAQQPAFTPTPGPVPGYQRPGTMLQNGGNVSRRGALGWLLGGAAIIVLGGGAAIYFYAKNNGQPGGSSSNGQGNPVLHVLKGHTAAVTGLSWLADGTKLASGSLDQTARLWSASDGNSTATFTAQAGLNSVAWSPDGGMLAAGEADHDVQLWKADGTPIKHETGWGGVVKGLAWRGDGNLLFIGTYGNGLHALQISNFKQYGKSNPSVRINAIAISPDGAYMAVALESGAVYFADLAKNWAQAATISSKHGSALSVDWSPDGKLLAVGYSDNSAVVYDATTRHEKYILKHKGPVSSVSWSQNTSTPILASGAGDGSVNIWNLGSNKQVVYSGHSDAVLAVAWSSNMLASGSKDQTAILWQPPSF